jgi:hypothetical protein
MRKWTKPQMIVLARGTPEERVLDACKTETLTDSHPLVSWYNACYGVYPSPECVLCSPILSS